MAKKKSPPLDAYDTLVKAFFPPTLFITAEDFDTSKADPTADAYFEIHTTMSEPDHGELVAVYELTRVARLTRTTTETLQTV